MKNKLSQGMKLAVNATLTMMANSRCVFCYHQPKQPKEIKKFRKLQK